MKKFGNQRTYVSRWDELTCFHWLLASAYWRSQFRWQQISASENPPSFSAFWRIFCWEPVFLFACFSCSFNWTKSIFELLICPNPLSPRPFDTPGLAWSMQRDKSIEIFPKFSIGLKKLPLIENLHFDPIMLIFEMILGQKLWMKL